MKIWTKDQRNVIDAKIFSKEKRIRYVSRKRKITDRWAYGVEGNGQKGNKTALKRTVTLKESVGKMDRMDTLDRMGTLDIIGHFVKVGRPDKLDTFGSMDIMDSMIL